MEQFKFKEKNFWEKFKNLSVKTRTFVFAMALSFGSFLPKESVAQIYPQIIPDSSTMEVKNPIDTLNPSIFKAVRESIIKQRDWVLEYIQSEKYLERLAKEYFYFKKMTGDTEKDSFNSEDFWNVKDNQGKSFSIDNLEEFFNEEPDLSTLTKEDWEEIKKLRDKRLENVKFGRWIIVGEYHMVHHGLYHISKVEGFFENDLYVYIGDKKEEPKKTEIPLRSLVLIRHDDKQEKEKTAVHEMGGHASVDGLNEMSFFTKNLIECLASSLIIKDLNNPAEVYARLFVFRRKLYELKLYDSNKEDFNLETWQNIKNKKKKYKILFEVEQIKDLFETLKVKDIIWLMNNVADMGDYYFISPEEIARNLKKQTQIG